MNNIWAISIDDYVAIIERAKADGCQPGENMQKWMEEYFVEKNINPIGKTELTKEEFLKEQISHNKSILNVETDIEGKQKISIIKKEESSPND